jgi:hypothetical protein
MRMGFADNFGAGWKRFLVTEDLVEAADQAAREWKEFAAYLRGKLQHRRRSHRLVMMVMDPWWRW